MSNGLERDYSIGAFVADLGNRSITAVANAINCCFRKVKRCYETFCSGFIQLKLEFRGRKSILCTYPNLINDIEGIIEKFKHQDSHFKSEFTFISIHSNSIIDTLITKYNYPKKFACYNTIVKVLKTMGYKYHKIPKSEIINKVPETDEIFENVNDCLESLDLKTNETFVTCTPYNSTDEFKVDCIEKYIIRKNKNKKLKKLILFLDNGPENSS